MIAPMPSPIARASSSHAGPCAFRAAVGPLRVVAHERVARGERRCAHRVRDEPRVDVDAREAVARAGGCRGDHAATFRRTAGEPFRRARRACRRAGIAQAGPAYRATCERRSSSCSRLRAPSRSPGCSKTDQSSSTIDGDVGCVRLARVVVGAGRGGERDAGRRRHPPRLRRARRRRSRRSGSPTSTACKGKKRSSRSRSSACSTRPADRSIRAMRSSGAISCAGCSRRTTRCGRISPAARSMRPMRPTQSSFSDLASSDPDFRYVQGLSDAGIAVGFPDKSFKADQPLTREQMIAIKSGLDRGGVHKSYAKDDKLRALQPAGVEGQGQGLEDVRRARSRPTSGRSERRRRRRSTTSAARSARSRCSGRSSR